MTDLDKMNEEERENGIEQQVLKDTVTILQKIVYLNISDSSIDILGPANNILDSRNTKSWKNMTVSIGDRNYNCFKREKNRPILASTCLF